MFWISKVPCFSSLHLHLHHHLLLSLLLLFYYSILALFETSQPALSPRNRPTAVSSLFPVLSLALPKKTEICLLHCICCEDCSAFDIVFLDRFTIRIDFYSKQNCGLLFKIDTDGLTSFMSCKYKDRQKIKEAPLSMGCMVETVAKTHLPHES